MNDNLILIISILASAGIGAYLGILFTKLKSKDEKSILKERQSQMDYTIAELKTLLSNLDIDNLLAITGASNVSDIIVNQPSFMEGLNGLLAETDIETWKKYFKWSLINDMAGRLNEAMDKQNFEFYSKTLSGVEEQRPMWRRAVSTVSGNLGEVVGEVYVSKHFKPDAKARMVDLVGNLIKAYEDGSDLEARGNMLATSSMGSIAFQKGLGAIHSLSHPVGALYNTHHGLTNAVFMPYVLKKNREVIEDKIVALSRYMNLDDQTFDGFMNWVLDLRKKLSIPHTLKELIKDDSKFEEMSQMAKDDPSTGGNPISLEISDFYNLYKDSYLGNL